jgi:hypothetical protein
VKLWDAFSAAHEGKLKAGDSILHRKISDNLYLSPAGVLEYVTLMGVDKWAAARYRTHLVILFSSFVFSAVFL